MAIDINSYNSAKVYSNLQTFTGLALASSFFSSLWRRKEMNSVILNVR